MQQVWNWFQNRRYALRARQAKTPVPCEVTVFPTPRDEQPTVVRNVHQAPQPQPAPASNIKCISCSNFLLCLEAFSIFSQAFHIQHRCLFCF